MSEAHCQKMPNCREIKREANSVITIQSVPSTMNGGAEVKLVNTIRSVSARTNVGAQSGGSRGDAMDWKKKYEEELHKRSTIEEQNDDLQTQVFNCKS